MLDMNVRIVFVLEQPRLTYGEDAKNEDEQYY